MKTDNITLSIKNPEQERYLSERREAINRQAVKDARILGEGNRPFQTDTSATPYTGSYSAQWLDVRTEGLQKIQHEAHTAKIKRAIDGAKKHHTEIKARIDELEHENRQAKYELDGKAPTGLRNLSRVGIAFAIICYLSEIAFNSWSFQFLGDSLLFSLIIAIGIGIGTIILARGIVDFLAKRDTLGRKAYLIAGGILAVALIFFSGLAVLRSQAFKTDNFAVGAWFFLSANLFFFIATVLICYFYFPKRKETEAEHIVSTLREAIAKRQEEIDRLRKELAEVSAALEEHIREYLHITSMAHHLVERVNSLHRETIELFKSANLIARKDQTTPDCFSEATPDLPPPPHIAPIDLNTTDQ